MLPDPCSSEYCASHLARAVADCQLVGCLCCLLVAAAYSTNCWRHNLLVEVCICSAGQPVVVDCAAVAVYGLQLLVGAGCSEQVGLGLNSLTSLGLLSPLGGALAWGRSREAVAIGFGPSFATIVHLCLLVGSGFRSRCGLGSSPLTLLC